MRSLSGQKSESMSPVREKQRKAEFPEQTKASGHEPERTREKESSRAERGQREARPGDQRTVRV